MPENRFTVTHRPEEQRYALLDHVSEGSPAEIGEEAYVDAGAAGHRDRVFYHTVVSEDYAGQGLGSVLVRAAVEDTIAAGFRVIPVCPYVAAWLRKHGEYAENVGEVRPAHLTALPRE